MPYKDPKQRALRRREAEIARLASKLAEPFFSMLVGDGGLGNRCARNFNAAIHKLIFDGESRVAISAAIYDLIHSLPKRNPTVWNRVAAAVWNDEIVKEALVANAISSIYSDKNVGEVLAAMSVRRPSRAPMPDVLQLLRQQVRVYARQQGWAATLDESAHP
jgi:hypothetical protein